MFLVVYAARCTMSSDERDTIPMGVSLPKPLYEDVLDSMGPNEHNKSARLCELVQLGLAAERALDDVGWTVPDSRSEQFHMLKQVLLDSDGE